MAATKHEIIARLQREILPLQGLKLPPTQSTDIGLGFMEDAFPNGVFPAGAIHEFLSAGTENAAASTAFIAGVLGALMQTSGSVVWISKHRAVFPHGLTTLGVPSDRVIFIDGLKEKETLWVTEEALKCKGLAAVVCELPEISFTASRRLQLAVEESRVTGFILRRDPRNLNANACTARWKISPLPGMPEEDLPGLGFPRWNIELLKIRNGRPGSWEVEWSEGKFQTVASGAPLLLPEQKEKPDDMPKRFVSIWFPHLLTDWFSIRRRELRTLPFVLVYPERGRMIVTATNPAAEAEGLNTGMALADARAVIPALQHADDQPGLSVRLLKALAIWSIRYSPIVGIDPPDGLVLDATGCAHLWGGEKSYLAEITDRLKSRGYASRIGMAGSIGASWAMAWYGQGSLIVEPGEQARALLSLPPAALRLEPEIIERLEKLGLRQVRHFIGMPRKNLSRRFGQDLLLRLDQALGTAEELIQPVEPPIPYQERLPCLEPILTITGIEIALERLLDALCNRLRREGKGLRQACFKGYRTDGHIEEVAIGTVRPSGNVRHLFKLFELKLPGIEPGPGIELFMLEASKVEDLRPGQERLWEGACGLEDSGLSELLDRVTNKTGPGHIQRYLPDEHYWPERSIKPAASLCEAPAITWNTGRLRPVLLLPKPERIEVTAPMPDYPPMLFRYKNKLHKIKRADGPERIEREWWLEQGPHRDYYAVEDEEGQRYWLFRSGHYTAEKTEQWFIHGFFG